MVALFVSDAQFLIGEGWERWRPLAAVDDVADFDARGVRKAKQAEVAVSVRLQLAAGDFGVVDDNQSLVTF